jgi:hypothetical protein
VRDVRQAISFGILVGALLGLFSGWQIVFAGDRALHWRILCGSAGVLLAAALIAPQALYWPQRAWTALGNVLGRIVLTLILGVVYVAVILPVGTIRQRLIGHNPFRPWTRRPPGETAWTRRNQQLETPEVADRQSSVQVVTSVIGFFVRQRNWFMLPALVLLIALGILVFFVQGTALAPMIYTLF